MKFVRCPECENEQADMGRFIKCEECGHGPMPTASGVAAPNDDEPRWA